MKTGLSLVWARWMPLDSVTQCRFGSGCSGSATDSEPINRSQRTGVDTRPGEEDFR